MTTSTITRRSKAPDARQLLNAACGIVAAGGWTALTLRPLAECLGVSVTVLSNHYGSRTEVVAAICVAGCANEERLFGGWRALLARVGPLDPMALADLADTVLDELAVAERALSLLFVEALQATRWDVELRTAFAPWLHARMGFWAELGRHGQLPAAVLDSGWLGGYFIDELAHSIALDGLPSYRLLRRLCLRRLFGGAARQGDGALFDALFDALDYRAGEIAVSHGQDAADGWPGRAARASALALIERGVGGLTHRAIASAAGVPHTTLSYRFPTQHDLVVAGLDYIIAHMVQAVDDGERSGEPPAALARLRAIDDQGLDVGRATFALAVAAARMPQLVPGAADMRRRRGRNLIKLLQGEMPALPQLDLIAAQIASVGMIGFAQTLPVSGSADYAAAFGGMLACLRHVPLFDQASPARAART